MITILIICLIVAAIVCANNPNKSIVSETFKAFFGIIGTIGCLIVIFIIIIIFIFTLFLI